MGELVIYNLITGGKWQKRMQTKRTERAEIREHAERYYPDRGKAHLKYLILGAWVEYFEGIIFNTACGEHCIKLDMTLQIKDLAV